jgi:hypothetical protein
MFRQGCIFRLLLVLCLPGTIKDHCQPSVVAIPAAILHNLFVNRKDKEKGNDCA